MTAQIIEDDDVTRPQRRDEHLFDVSAEALAVESAVEDAGRGDAGSAQTGDQGGHFPVPVWHRRQEAQPARGPAAAARHVGGRTGFVDEDEAARVERRLPPDEGPPGVGNIGALLLGGMQALFLSVSLLISRNRHTVVSPTLMPCSACSRAQISAKVRSGSRATNRSTASR